MEQKITKKETREVLRKRLGEDDRWALHALKVIYGFQTASEQQEGVTREFNGVGFTGVDAEILTSFAQQFERRGFLTPKQMKLLKKKMPKYWQQIERVANPEKVRAEVLLERRRKAETESTLFIKAGA